MIILAIGSGNHSNRLLQNINFEAFCKENNIEYINPSFFNMHKYYSDPCKLHKGLKGVLFFNPFFFRIFRKIKRSKLFVNNIISFDDENNNNVLPSPPPESDIYVSGWYFRVDNLTKKYQDFFIKKYSLKEKYFKNNILFNKIIELKERNRFVIGIHIRRGDYKTWMNGQYYFDDSVYLKYMQNVKTIINQINRQECSFIIFSNDIISINETENIYISRNTWYIDHLLMSKCNLLIGPPSTFTLWASYIGKIKYFQIANDSGEIKVDDFKYCNGC
jgi:hypothetical protein